MLFKFIFRQNSNEENKSGRVSYFRKSINNSSVWYKLINHTTDINEITLEITNAISFLRIDLLCFAMCIFLNIQLARFDLFFCAINSSLFDKVGFDHLL